MPTLALRPAATVIASSLFAALLAPATATAAPFRETAKSATSRSVTKAQARVADKLNQRIRAAALGGNTAGFVVDANTGRRIWSRRAHTGMLPASVTKLATALAALDVLGADSTVTTRVVEGSTPDRLVLVGSGDALLTTSDVARLADQTAARLREQGLGRVTVFFDDSLFPAPTMATGWLRGYYPRTVAPVRALIVDQRESYDTSLSAAQVFVRALTNRGVTVRAVARARRPAGTPVLAAVESSPIRDWVAQMLLVSDNDIAENLARLTAVRAGRSATWANARAVRALVLRKYGISRTAVNLHDGSGLSRANRMSSAGVIAILRAAHKHPRLQSLFTGLPVAGQTGSLRTSRGRFAAWPSRCATGRVAAKTGLLRGSITLAGRARTADGRDAFFVFMENGRPSVPAIKRTIDGLAATVTGCW